MNISEELNKVVQTDYTKAPPQEVFDDIKKNAIKVWQQYDNQFGYVDEKVGAIKDLENVSDNAWYMVAMFDLNNKHKLYDLCSEKTREYLKDAIEQEEQAWFDLARNGIIL